MSKENWHFHHLGTKRSSQYQEKRSWITLSDVCNLRLTLSMICLYRKMRQKGVRYESFLFPVCFRIVVLFAVVLEIVTQGVCLCVTTPRATSRKIAPFYFIRDNYFLVDFVPEKHLFVAYFASKCKLLDKDKSDFYHKDLLRVYQKQNLALSLSLLI